ncbi:MAG: hypothetical protein HGN29_08585 [Asgard group archaeon]|nr:hypothetical protein [Asgard group archaeon]
MKNKNKMILMSSILSLVLFVSFIPSIQGQYSYLLTLEAGTSYGWEVTTLTTVGTVYTPFLNYGHEILKQGDRINITLLQDVNSTALGGSYQLFFNVSIIWVEFYLNDEFVTNVTTEIGLFDIDSWINLGMWSGWFYEQFLLPITYTNSTGKYDNFQVLHNNYQQGTGDLKSETNFHSYSESVHLKVKTTSKLSKDTWSIKRVYSEVYKESDYTDPEDWDTTDRTLDITTELRYNRATGLLVYVNHDYAWHEIYQEEGSTEDNVEEIIFIVESSELSTKAPYNWAFVLLGILTIGIIVLWRKKN